MNVVMALGGTVAFVALVVDVATRTVTASIPCARGPFQVAALSDDQRAIVACDSTRNADTILAVDRATSQVLAATTIAPPVVQRRSQ